MGGTRAGEETEQLFGNQMAAVTSRTCADTQGRRPNSKSRAADSLDGSPTLAVSQWDIS